MMSDKRMKFENDVLSIDSLLSDVQRRLMQAALSGRMSEGVKEELQRHLNRAAECVKEL